MPCAIILAGGLGTRLRSEVPDLPKPMAPVDGRPFLEILLDYWISQGIDRFILSVGYKYDAIVDHFKHNYRSAKIEYSIEEVPLGTGGGFLTALGRLQSEEDFLLLNGDTYFAVELNALRRFAVRNNADWCFSMFRTNEGNRYMGMQVDVDGRVLSLRSEWHQAHSFVNGGVYWVRSLPLRRRAANPMRSSLESDFFPQALARNERIFGLESEGVFIDIGVPEDYRRARSLIL